MHGDYLAQINGLRLWYRRAGSGPPLVVQAPGWGVGCAYLIQTLRPLEERFTVIYYDPRGSGKSARPGSNAEINVGAIVHDLELLRRHLGLERFSLFGHSHGGYIALNYALRHQAHLSHLIVAGCMLGPDELEADMAASVPRLAERSEYARAAAAWRDAGPFISDAEFGEWLQQTLPLSFHRPAVGMSVFARVKQENPSLAAAQGTRPSDREFPVRDQLDRIHVPTLILAGRHDFKTSVAQEMAIHRGIPGSRLVVFEESGHFPWFEEPLSFFRAIKEFVQEGDAR
jgi:pimeloyl-ACP methyl ester carboxylesterase